MSREPVAKLWGGRFEGGLDPFFERFNRSLPFDRRMVDEDLRGSIAWANALGAAGVLSKSENQKLCRALDKLRKSLEKDSSAIEQSAAEDVHSFVEQALGDLVGNLAKKLHTGRSRNDQVGTDLKLWLKQATGELISATEALMLALSELALEYADLPIPGYTHLQRAQPITAGHHALAYTEMLARDRSRLTDALERMDTCPLGCGALAGTAFPVDRRAIARELGFKGGPTRNSLDAVSDRDHVCDVLYASSMIMIHLSRLAEDWIFFASHEASFIKMSDLVATGSSLMPQKKNPDAMELIRGKTGRVAGHLQALMMTLKGLPLAYDKDLQEDKEGLFDALDTTIACVKVARTAVRSTRYQETRCREASTTGYLDATDLADLLVQKGVPFRDAHERTGIAVRQGLEHGVELSDLPKALIQELFPELKGSLAAELKVEKVLARRKAIGGTAPARVRREAKAWQKKLS